MKQIYTLLFVLSSYFLSAQPVINAEDFTPGQGWWYSVSQVEWLDPGPAGADQVWDFSDLEELDYFEFIWETGDAGPGGEIFSESTHSLMVLPEESYQYFTYTSDSAVIDGIAFEIMNETIALEFTDPQRMYEFPISFEQSFTDTFQVEMDGVLLGKTVLTTTVDGYGSLLFPWESQGEVLRLKREGQSESYIVDELGNILDTSYAQILQYDFITANITVPLLTLQEVSDEFGTSYSAQAMLGIVINNTAENKEPFTEIYPNPSPNGDLIVRSDQPFEAIRLWDLSGKCVFERSFQNGENQIEIQLSHLSEGIYLVEVFGDSGRETTKWMKTR
jgi:hypothetical protein